jgi:Regulator of chromosome condensation (RCC1) repeat
VRAQPRVTLPKGSLRSLRTAFLSAPIPLTACALLSWACSSERAGEPGLHDAPLADASTDGAAPDDAPGKPPFDPTDEPVTCATTPCAVEIVAGEKHFCARMSDGTVRCWGGSASDAGVHAVDIANATQISAAGGTTCALVADGSVACWGRNDKGQLGIGDVDTDVHPTPSTVALESAARRVDVGPSSACAVLVSGEVWCWGDNSRKQLARPAPAEVVSRPVKAELGEVEIARTAAGTYTGFAVTAEGGLLSWAAVAWSEGSVGGRVSSVSPDERPFPVDLGPVSSFSVSSTTILAGSNSREWPKPARGIAHACAVVSGEVFCWGDSLAGAIGDGLPGPVVTPVRAAIASSTAWARQVVAAGDITCARLTNGNVECTGDNARGALGMGTVPFSFVFKPVSGLHERAMRLAASSRSVCAIVQGGTVVCWGSNESNELGQGVADVDAHVTPVPVHF